MAKDQLQSRHSQSIHEMRRRAPGHFRAKAHNARMAAYGLSKGLKEDTLMELASEINYSGTPSVAINEAFHREASISLELIIKAHLATRIERGIGPKNLDRPPAIHDVVQLWGMAKLPLLAPDDELILHRVKSLLEWSSRYAEPRDNIKYQKEIDTEEAVYRRTGRDQIFRRYPIFDWDCFDRLYQCVVAETSNLERGLAG